MKIATQQNNKFNVDCGQSASDVKTRAFPTFKQADDYAKSYVKTGVWGTAWANVRLVDYDRNYRSELTAYRQKGIKSIRVDE